MNELPACVPPPLRRLARRLAVGLFLDVWPPWAAGSLLAAGAIAIACRLLAPGASFLLPWLWLTPLIIAIPAVFVCARRAYRPSEIVALADSLSGGHGLVVTLFERGAAGWAAAPQVAQLAALRLPRIRAWRRLAAIPAAAALLAVGVSMPQRSPAASNVTLANTIAEDLTRTVDGLKRQDLLTPADEKRLDEEIERIRQAAMNRIDASTWEAADAMRENVAASVAAKQDAVTWAEQSLARYAAAAADGAATPPSDDGASADAQSAELMKALLRLEESGLLAGAPANLQQLLKDGKVVPGDAASLRKLAASLSEFLAERQARLERVAQLGKEKGRFDPEAFGFNFEPGPDGDGNPGAGGVNRGRADAPLTWGKESQPFDRFKAQPLPPGAMRSPDDWAPLAELPGAPQIAPRASAPAATQTFAGTAGQTAWRRTLAPRHQSAVRRYFDQ